MPFYISFSALSNSPPNSELGGSAGYFRVKLPFLPGMPTYTNRLEVGFSSPAPPEDAWILEKQEDGSFLPVTEVTNLFGDASNGYYLDQPLALSIDQVQSLIAGNWYAEVDFGSSNYLGNLAPQPAFGTGPTAAVKFPPPIPYSPSSYTAIALDNRTARVVFDGSPSTDPFYLPMQYSWTGWAGYFTSGDPVFTGTQILTTNVFEVGTYIISLQVSDSMADGHPHYFSLQVATPCQAMNPLISVVQRMSLPKMLKKVLLDVLSASAADFDRGNMNKGLMGLQLYERLVKASHFSAEMTFFLTSPAQPIIDAFSVPGKKR